MRIVAVLILAACAALAVAGEREHPRLLLSAADVALMRGAPDADSAFSRSVAELQRRTDLWFENLPDVPVPVDPGGGYTHEQHKRNGIAIHDAGVLYQITGDARYMAHARELLLRYAGLYPTLGEHPVKRSRTPGRLFWQSLNEAVWLVYAVQGFDAIHDSLTVAQRRTIEDGVLRPLADFISVESPQTFDRMHNHGTWAVAAVGMTGYVLGDRDYVQRALYGLAVDGRAGFVRQLDELFSPDGYYTEGPYYQRYALMPFVLFARSIEANDPDLNIFAYRDGVLLKAIYACVELSYGGLFFPVNDAIKDKGLDTVELRYGISIAYALTGDAGLLSIAGQQGGFVPTGDGFRVARAIDDGLARPYPYRSMAFGDGPQGGQGALMVLRSGMATGQALLFNATSQGMGHGHFDRLNWLFYDNGREIVTDYGAARFLNVAEKSGGRYLAENESWAKQTVAHNTLVVDGRSHFDGDVGRGEGHHPQAVYFDQRDGVRIGSAESRGAYEGVVLRRTLALLDGVVAEHALVVDVLGVQAQRPHRLDLPLHFAGQIITAAPALVQRKSLRPLGRSNGYQHLWLRAAGAVNDDVFSLTWLNGDRFYTFTTLAEGGLEVFAAELGANDPLFNLRREQALLLRAQRRRSQTFVSVLEPHGEYNGTAEFTRASRGAVAGLARYHQDGKDLIRITLVNGVRHYLALSYDSREEAEHRLLADGREFRWRGFHDVFVREPAVSVSDVLKQGSRL